MESDDEKERTGKDIKRRPLPNRDLMDELFVTLLRLRQNPHLTLIHLLTGFSAAKISSCFHTWLRLLNEFLGKLVRWPGRAEAESILSPVVAALYPGLTGIVDCTELYLEKSHSLEAQSRTWSTYKHNNTAKYLIVIRGDGGVSFISKGYPGCLSDNVIFRESLKSVLKPGDVILADRGFKVVDFCRAIGVQLEIPPSLKEGDQLSPEENVKTKKIANVRVHVERQIGYMKDFKMISGGDIDLRLIGLLDAIMQVIGGLVNLNKRIM